MSSKSKDHTDVEYFNKIEYLEREKNINGWKSILDYRMKHSFVIPLLFNEKKNVFLTQTPWILQKEIRMMNRIIQHQQEVVHNLSKWHSSDTIISDVFTKSITSDIKWLLDGQKKDISRRVVSNLVNNIDDPSNDEEKYILELYDYFTFISEKEKSPRAVAKRFFGFKKFKPSEKFLDEIHVSLLAVLKSSKINSILTKISSIFYAVVGNEMFGENSYKVAILTIFSLLNNSYLKSVTKGVSLFKIFDFFKVDIESAMKNVKNENGDLTYLYNEFRRIITYITELSTEQIKEYIDNEKRYNALTLREKAVTIKSMMRDYPMLTKNQLNFWMVHNDKHKNFTLNDYQSFVGSSYETSRYSMEKLVGQGFYKKEKVGKKFIYRPIKKV